MWYQNTYFLISGSILTLQGKTKIYPNTESLTIDANKSFSNAMLTVQATHVLIAQKELFEDKINTNITNLIS